MATAKHKRKVVQQSADRQSVDRQCPDLVPIASTSKDTDKADQSLLDAQIRINTKAMQEIDDLKKAGQEVFAQYEKSNKEREVLQAKYDRALEQLQYLKKKIGNRKSGDENADPNADPNANN